jgi:MerR family transcriptional regulator, thiopeptide resistance regulator
MTERTYAVGEVARLVHVSVRTLRHYDTIGLLQPSGRSESGYRLYVRDDLERLLQILFYRELGFSLTEIGREMLDPGFDRRAALRHQREALAGKVRRSEAVLKVVDQMLALPEGRMTMRALRAYEQATRKRFGVAGDDDGARDVQASTKDDWAAVTLESDAIKEEMASLLEAGVPADDARAMDAAERHRRFIDERFYRCPPEMHAELGEMLVMDPGVTLVLDADHPGLAEYMRKAIRANALRAASDDDHSEASS